MSGTCIVTAGLGSWYPCGVARLIQQFWETQAGLPILSWVNTLPSGSPPLPYCAKPFAMMEGRRQGFDTVIWLDAAFYPVKRIDLLIDWIACSGYYLCLNGSESAGEWCSDAALETLGITREESFTIREVSSYCIGLNFRRPVCHDFLDRWAAHALDGKTFQGFFNNINWAGREAHPEVGDGRSLGFVSADPRVRGHRQDQTAASVIAWRLGMSRLVSRPIFTDYWKEDQDPRTLLVNRGGCW